MGLTDVLLWETQTFDSPQDLQVDCQHNLLSCYKPDQGEGYMCSVSSPLELLSLTHFHSVHGWSFGTHVTVVSEPFSPERWPICVDSDSVLLLRV